MVNRQRPRDFSLPSVFILEVMAVLLNIAVLGLYVCYPVDSESENDEVNDRFEAHFGVHVNDASHAELVQPLFLQTRSFLNGKLSKLNVFLYLYPTNVNNHGQKTSAFSKKKKKSRQEQPESVLLSQMHFELPAKFKLDGMTSRLVAWPLSPTSKWWMSMSDFWLLCWLISRIACILEAEISVTKLNITFLISNDRKNTLFGVPFSFKNVTIM